MLRLAYQELLRWKTQLPRKPLVLKGARQVGKTWLMKEFGRREFSHVAYINFETSRNICRAFQQNFSIANIIEALRIETGVPIHPDSTLILFDEVQECPDALTSLKYFQEQAPEYALIAAGSLLGVAMHAGQSFPVGKVAFLDLFPMNFEEFLFALGEETLLEALRQKNWPLVSVFKERYADLLRRYFFVGGMPEAVSTYAEKKDLNQVREIQQFLLQAYEQDFSEHAPVSILPRIRMVWQSIPSQLAKENKKFIYGIIRQGARAKDFELALAWLHDAGLINQVHRISKPAIPLNAYLDLNHFKVYLHDVGLLGAMGQIAPGIILEGNKLFQEFKGALTEQYVLQQLLSIGFQPFFWSVKKSEAEVDFVIQYGNELIPIEVKAAENVRAKSLRVYFEKFHPVYCLRSSMSDFREQEWLKNIPLYALPFFFIRE